MLTRPTSFIDLTWTDVRRDAAIVALSGMLYALAAYAALYLQSPPEAVAIFWPASGVAAGLLLSRGSWAGPVAVGTLAGTFLANILQGRSAALALIFGLVNAAEAVLVAKLARIQSGDAFSLQRLTDSSRFVVAAISGCALAAVPAAAAISLLGVSSAPVLDIWRVWVFSDFVGVVVLAPLVVAVVGVVARPASRYDWTLDIALLMLLAVVTWNTITLPNGSGNWQALAPGTTVLPVIVWLAIRGQPLAPALGLVVVAVLMAFAAGLGLGRFGDAAVPAENRVFAAQASLTVLTLVTIFASAVFHERRDAEARLRDSTARLAAISEASPGTMFSLILGPAGMPRFDFLASTAASVLGLGVTDATGGAGSFPDRLAPEDRRALERALGKPLREAEPFRLEVAYSHPALGDRWIELSAAPVADERGGVVWHGYAQDVTGRRIMTEELNHRTRNLLTVVQAVTQLTASTTEPSRFADLLAERMQGLLRCHDLLDARQWHDIAIDEIATAQLSHLAGLFGTRIRLEGPRLLLTAGAAQIIGMAMHELATNALKYGALSNETGQVRIAWSLQVGEKGDRLVLEWRESGGPPVAPPTRRGFGRRVVLDMVRHQLSAEVTLEYRSDGLLWRLDAPATRALEPRPA